MKLENYIRKSMREYPSLFYNRTQVIEHLFLVIGNGGDWVNGQIKFCDDRARYHRRKFQDPREVIRPYRDVKTEIAWKKLIGERVDEFEIRFLKEHVKEHNRQTKLIVENVKTLSKLHVPQADYYPICEYSAIIDMPDDVRVDWLKGALEAAGLVLKTKNTQNHKEIKKALPRLRKLAKKHGLDAQAIIDSIPEVQVTSEGSWYGRSRENQIRKLLGKPLLKETSTENTILKLIAKRKVDKAK